MENRTLLTDLYQLTMMAAYHESGKQDDIATFDLFIRKYPEDWGYLIAAGIEDAVDYATNISFSEDDISYLRDQGLFKDSFLDYLKDFKFHGEITAVPEGTPVAANTPLLRVTAPRSEAQLLETMLLNTVNFQTMIASKTSRVVNAAGLGKVVDFGLRRAQEKDAAMKGARAAYIGGAAATSNVAAGKEYGIPISGTMAHSFIMSFPTELEAFRAYADTFPDSPTLLIDTYDNIEGAKNAAIIGKELIEKGKRLGAVRLDSGDLTEISKDVRRILDENDLGYVRIVASSDLNEYKIDEMKRKGAKVNGFGVGTEMITAKPTAAISGVYKLVEDEAGHKIKLAPGKKTYPGKKQVYRVADENGNYTHDILALENEPSEGTPLLQPMVSDGQRLFQRRNLEDIREYSLKSVRKLPQKTRETRAKRYISVPSKGLQKIVDALTHKYTPETEIFLKTYAGGA
ncbi:nicotinate phosphoribosyltransferase [Candidatus Woesearchaeota archaeon]|nr:nicotinate phosphoribosyltransferase [Candidatus Woesearchaeota archaeon]